MKKFICEVCGKEHDGSFGSGRFCSKSCASVLGARKKNSLYPPKKLPPKIEVRICQKCGKKFEVDLRKDDKRYPKRFCSSYCSHSRVHSEENRQKISNKLKETNHNKYGGLTKAEYAKKHNYESVLFDSKIQLPERVCKVCGRAFYHRFQRETCSPKCRVQLNKERQREHFKNFPKTHYKMEGEWTEDAYKSIYKFYYTYKITNLLDGHYYLGIHMTNDLNDGYMGSGIRIKRAIKKYGIENFNKSYLQFFKCYKDLVTAEFELITQDILKDPYCYNLSEGGVGGPNFRGKTHTAKTKLKLCEQRNLQQERDYTKLKEFYAYYLLNGWACAKQTFEYKSSFRAFKERLKSNYFINSYKDLKYIP